MARDEACIGSVGVLSVADKMKIFEGNAYKVYSRLKQQIAKQAA